MPPRLILLFLSLCCVPSLRAEPTDLPRPPALEPAVRFWTRVFTEVDTRSGFLHDDRELGVVYETLSWSGDLGRAGREALVEPQRRAVQNTLLALADGTANTADPQVRRVRALWQGASPEQLRAAAARVRFQLGQSDRFSAALRRAGLWEPHIRSTLREHGVPQEIGALPYVESGFDPMAGSYVGAAGLWQFMASTGRLFLRIDQFVDERYDPHAATVAAAKLLRGNYDALGTWPLALTAYNHGRAGMRRAVDTVGSDDIAVLIERYDGPAFGFASRNFYPTFLAAQGLSANPEPHFGPIAKSPPARMQEVTLPAYLPLRAVETQLGVNRAELQALNPALRRGVWEKTQLLPKGYDLRLPADTANADTRIASLSRQVGRASLPPTEVRYTVRRGDTLGRVAARHGLRVSQLAARNGLKVNARLRIGQVLKVPVRTSTTRR